MARAMVRPLIVAVRIGSVRRVRVVAVRGRIGRPRRGRGAQ